MNNISLTKTTINRVFNGGDSELFHTFKKALPAVDEPSISHMQKLFQPETFTSRIEQAIKPTIEDTYILTPSEFKRVGKEAIDHLLQDSNSPPELLELLAHHQNHELLIETYRNLLLKA